MMLRRPRRRETPKGLRSSRPVLSLSLFLSVTAIACQCLPRVARPDEPCELGAQVERGRHEPEAGAVVATPRKRAWEAQFRGRGACAQARGGAARGLARTSPGR